MDHYADDLAALLDTLDLRNVTLVGIEIARGTREAFWRQGLQAGHKNAYDSIAAFSATDMRDDLRRVDVPTLVIHGDDDQVVPFDVGGRASAALVKDACLKVHQGPERPRRPLLRRVRCRRGERCQLADVRVAGVARQRR